MIEFISQLPTEYQEVEYIQSSGTQYIDTGFVVNKSDSYVLEIDGLFPSQAQAYQGCNGYMQFFVTNKYGISDKSSISVGNRDTVRIAYANQTATLTVNGSQAESKSWASYSGANVKLGVLRMGDVNNGWFNGDAASGTIYGYKVWKDEVLVSDCIPCYRKSDNVAGLYDLVNNVFYTNAGTGSFSVGNAVGGGIVITAGGVIPIQYALRRRMMGAAIKKTWTVQITNTLSYGSFLKWKDDESETKYTSKATFTVPDGSVAILSCGSLNPKVYLNGEVVASGNILNPAVYEFVVSSDANISYSGGNLGHLNVDTI